MKTGDDHTPTATHTHDGSAGKVIVSFNAQMKDFNKSRDRLEEIMKAYIGSGNYGKLMILEEGTSIEHLKKDGYYIFDEPPIYVPKPVEKMDWTWFAIGFSIIPSIVLAWIAFGSLPVLTVIFMMWVVWMM